MKMLLVVLVVAAYLLGNLTGYASGYNDRLTVEVAKYRVNKKLTTVYRR
jgi:hypothetical protein